MSDNCMHYNLSPKCLFLGFDFTMGNTAFIQEICFMPLSLIAVLALGFRKPEIGIDA